MCKIQKRVVVLSILIKNLFDYDDVVNKQRNIVYHERRQILESL